MGTGWNRRGALLRLAMAMAMAMASGASWAQAPAAGTSGLDAILRRGKVLIAVDMGSPPYAMTDAQMKPQGADVEAAELLAKDLGVPLEIVPTTGQGRVPVLLSGKADFVMATFSITTDRAKSVAFSNPYGIIRSVVFGAKNVAIKTPADMKSKRIGVTRGTTQEGALADTAPQGTTITRFDDDATAIAALASGQVDALATADNRGFVLNQRFPDRFEVKYELGIFYYAVGMRRGDPDLQHWVDTWVFVNMHNGTLSRIFAKWLKSDLPTLPTM